MKTTDINLAAYLKMQGFPCEIEKHGRKGVFLFDEVDKEATKAFYSSEIHQFALQVRGLKSQITNTPITKKTGES